MENTLLDEFEKYEIIKNKEEITDLSVLSPTITLPLICSRNLKIGNSNTIKEIDSKKGYFEYENEIISQLNIPEYNRNTLNFVFHELTSNIYDHSKFTKGLVMGKSYTDFKEISFMDNGITIPVSLKNANYTL